MASQSEVAAHLDLSQQAVSKLKKAGVLPAPSGRGGYDLDASRLAYIRNLRESAAGRDSSRIGSLEAERARLASAQAEAQERKNAVERGDLVPFREFHSRVLDTMHRVAGFLDHLPLRLAGADYKLRKRLEDSLNEAREELVAGKIFGPAASELDRDELEYAAD